MHGPMYIKFHEIMFHIREEPPPMKTFTGQKRLVEGRVRIYTQRLNYKELFIITLFFP